MHLMKYLSLIAVAILSTIVPCRADSASLFRDAFECSDRGPLSVCVYGTVPKGSLVTVLAKGWKSPAVIKEAWPNDSDGFQNGVKTITRLQVTTAPPKDATMIAVLAPAKAVDELPLEEIQDDALVGKAGQFIKTAKGLNLAPDMQVLKTRLFKLSSAILLSETFLSTAENVAALEKELPTGCVDCDAVPLFMGQTPEDLFKEIRSTTVNVESTCGGLRFAFGLSDRTYLLSHAFACESDSFSATLIHDLSGPKPKLVFKLTGGF
jgi:hypothetical protein